jgi:guanylate kinase
MDTDGEEKAAVSIQGRSGAGERPALLRKLIQRARALMEYSTACTREERDELVDGAGKRNAEAFIRPLSQGAVVMLRRHLEVLEKAFSGSGIEQEV